MKIKVKGLVFVGFAAAILSANAALAEATPANTVTSKAYVDGKFQTINNIQTAFTEQNKNSTTQYPSMGAVTATLAANGGAVENSTIDIQLNGTSKGTFTVNQATDGTINIDGVEVTANKAGTITGNESDTTKYPTTKAVADYVSGELNNTSNVGDGTLSITVNNTTQSFTANQAGNTTFSVTGLEETANKLDGSVGNTIADNTTSTTAYPSAKAVADYVATQAAASNFVSQTITDGVTGKAPSEDAVHDALALKADTSSIGNGTLTVSVNGTANATTFTANQAGNSTIAITGLEETANKVDSTTGLSASSTDTEYPSAKTVYDAIQDATGGNTIPEQDANLCDATHPCALINENGTLSWQRIAQAGDQ